MKAMYSEKSDLLRENTLPPSNADEQGISAECVGVFEQTHSRGLTWYELPFNCGATLPEMNRNSLDVAVHFGRSCTSIWSKSNRHLAQELLRDKRNTYMVVLLHSSLNIILV